MRHPVPPGIVRVGGLVRATIEGQPTTCRVLGLTVVSTGRKRDEAELFLVNRLYKVTLKTGEEGSGSTFIVDGINVKEVL
jgi:hypothetical protein